MKTKKNFLFGLIGAGALILSGSVGFAAWTIKNTIASKDDSTLHISADAIVNDESLQLTEDECKWTDSIVQFKPVEKTGLSYSWLSASDPAKTDDLTAIYQIKGKASASAKITIQATFDDLTQASKEKDVKSYQDLTTLGTNSEQTPGKGIVGALPSPTITDGAGGAVTNSITADENGNFSASVSVTFSWGAAFGGKNPYEYYNSKPYKYDLATEAKTNIEYLAYLPKCSFKLTVNVTVA